MKLGDLVMLKRPILNLNLHEGDLAILVKVDWDHNDYPAGISGNMGRGYFYFPNRPPSKLFEGQAGYLLLYESFEVLE